MENLDLKEIRNKLDEIDTQLVGLFEKRMALCSDVAEFKIQTGKKVYDGERERQKMLRFFRNRTKYSVFISPSVACGASSLVRGSR